MMAFLIWKQFYKVICLDKLATFFSIFAFFLGIYYYVIINGTNILMDFVSCFFFVVLFFLLQIFTIKMLHFGIPVLLGKLQNTLDTMNLFLFSDKNPFRFFTDLRFKFFLIVRGILLEHFPINTLNYFLLGSCFMSCQSLLFINGHGRIGFLLFLVPMNIEILSLAMVHFFKRHPHTLTRLGLPPLVDLGGEFPGDPEDPKRKKSFSVRYMWRAVASVNPSSAMFLAGTAAVGGLGWMAHTSYENHLNRQHEAQQRELDHRREMNQRELDRRHEMHQRELDRAHEMNQRELDRINSTKSIAWSAKNSAEYSNLSDAQKSDIENILKSGRFH